MNIKIILEGKIKEPYFKLGIEEFKKREKNLEVIYIGTHNRMEKDIIPKLGIPYIGLSMSGLNRKNIFKNFLF